MEKVKTRSGIKLKVPKALTREEFSNPIDGGMSDKKVTLYMKKQSILELRLAYENALKNGVNTFLFEGNDWLRGFAKTSLLYLEYEAKKRG